MVDFAFTPWWWIGIVLFGGMTVVSVLEWFGVVRTPFERVWPATAMGTGLVSVLWLGLLVFAAIAEVLELRVSGSPSYTPAVIVLMIVGVTAAGLVLAFRKSPPRWAVPAHLRGESD